MKPTLQAILDSKRAERGRLAALPFSEKVAMLEKLRDRAWAIAGSDLYRAHEPAGGKAWVLRERSPENRP